MLIAQSGANLVLFASSDSPKGPFTHTSTDMPPGVVNGGTGDQTVFQDDGWNTSPAYLISATNIRGPYSAEKVMVNSDVDYSHVTQTGFFATVYGTEDTTVVFSGDRWSKYAGNGVGYNQWTPVSFNGTDAVFNSLSRWTLDVVKGTWKVAPGNNYILNPAFEADRIFTENMNSRFSVQKFPVSASPPLSWQVTPLPSKP